MSNGHLWPAEEVVQKYFEDLNYTVDRYHVLDFMIYDEKKRFCVEVKTPKDKLSSVQISVGELLSAIGVETYVVVADSVHLIHIAPMRGLIPYIEGLKETDVATARILGSIVRIPSYEFESDPSLRLIKKNRIDKTLEASGRKRREPFCSPFLRGKKLEKISLRPEQLLEVIRG